MLVRPLMVVPHDLAVMFGINEAFILQKISYCLSDYAKGLVGSEGCGSEYHFREKDGRLWVSFTYEEWISEFPWMSVALVSKKVRRLNSEGVITTERCTDTWGKARWYTINKDRLKELGDKWDREQNKKLMAELGEPAHG